MPKDGILMFLSIPHVFLQKSNNYNSELILGKIKNIINYPPIFLSLNENKEQNAEKVLKRALSQVPRMQSKQLST